MKTLKVGDSVWHPCSLDVIEHEVITITESGYICKATQNVGACGRVVVTIVPNNGKFSFSELLTDSQYASGLEDLVEGDYFTSKVEAFLAFYEQQRYLIDAVVERAKYNYENALWRRDSLDEKLRELKSLI